MRRARHAILLVAVALLFSFCIRAFNKLAYNTLLPRIIVQRINKYFDLNSTQEAELKQKLKVHHAWHRETQLKLYVADLVEVKSRFARQLNDRDIDWLLGRLTLHRNTLFKRVIPDLATIMLTLEPRQVDHLEKELAEENAELRKRLTRPLAERQAEEFATVISHAENWAGKLSDEQKQRLREKYAAIPDSVGDWLDYRIDQQAVFLRLLRSKPTYKQLIADLEGRMVYQEKNIPKRFRSSFARTAGLMRQMILGADAILTAEQRKRVIQKADEYIQLLSELAQNP